MKKEILFIICFFVMVQASCWADTVYLKDGRVIEGTIFSETKYSVKLKAGNRPKVFYTDEIDRIEYGEQKTDPEEPLPEEVSEEKKRLILRFLEANGALDGIRQSMRNFIGQISPEMKKEFEDLLQADALTEQFIPIYAKYFTEEELKEMIRFYSSPTAQKLIEVNPQIMQDSIRAAVNYFKDMEENKSVEP